jgi:hypothetical protein
VERRRRSDPEAGDIRTQLIVNLTVGEHIWLQDIKTKRWKVPAKVLEIRANQRSVICETEDGGVYLKICQYTRKRTNDDADVLVAVVVVTGDRTTNTKVPLRPCLSIQF